VDVSSFFISIVAIWGSICLLVVGFARLCARDTPSNPSESNVPVRVYDPSGESLSAIRLTGVLIGVTAPLGFLWLSGEMTSAVHRLAGIALVCAFLISLAHGLRRRALDADTLGER